MLMSIPARTPTRHRVIPEKADRMAKSLLRKTESEDAWLELGECIDQVRYQMHWTIDELAAHLPPPKGKEKRDAAQVQRWIQGDERPQIEVVFAVPDLRRLLVIALAKLALCEIETTVRIRA